MYKLNLINDTMEDFIDYNKYYNKPCKVKYIINGEVYYCNFCLNKFCKKKNKN